MTVSVIVPVYNVAEFLGECVRSVLDEADSCVELICVDDGSTDGSGEMLDELTRGAHESTVKVIHQANAGVGAARNAALDAATGDWIMFLDGDDVLAKGWLIVVKTLAERHPSTQMLGFGYTKSRPRPVAVPGESREVDVLRVVGEDVYGRLIGQFAYRRETIAGLRFGNLVRGEDKLFQGEALLKAMRVALVDVPLYGYRQRESSAMHSKWNRDNFGDELSWRKKWLKAMTAAGKTMDSRLWRDMGLCFLEYMPFHLAEVDDASLRAELESRWLDALREAAAYHFSPWQRFAMRIVGASRSAAAIAFFCRLPFALKQAMGRYHPAPSEPWIPVAVDDVAGGAIGDVQ